MTELSPYDKARKDLNMLDRYHNLRLKKKSMESGIRVQEMKLERMRETYRSLCRTIDEQIEQIKAVHKSEGLSL